MNLNFSLLENFPIFSLLQIEEALLRTDQDNWCIINIGSPDAIVMSSYSKKEDWLFPNAQHSKELPHIKRFSGGGTVYVDHNTFFVTFICNQKNHSFDPHPPNILKWTLEIFNKALKIDHFSLTGNDFTIRDKKVGGNAHYLKKDRWLQHTSFLYDFDINNMNRHLPQPIKIPTHRKDRSHMDFLTKLRLHISKEEFISSIRNRLSSLYNVSHIPSKALTSLNFKDHRKLTRYLGI